MRARCWLFLDEEDDVVSPHFIRTTLICFPNTTPPGFQLPQTHSREDISCRLSLSMVCHAPKALMHRNFINPSQALVDT